jgi:hypothetical protein
MFRCNFHRFLWSNPRCTLAWPGLTSFRWHLMGFSTVRIYVILVNYNGTNCICIFSHYVAVWRNVTQMLNKTCCVSRVVKNPLMDWNLQLMPFKRIQRLSGAFVWSGMVNMRTAYVRYRILWSQVKEDTSWNAETQMGENNRLGFKESEEKFEIGSICLRLGTNDGLLWMR